MNERIQELYEQATEEHVSNNMAWAELNPEKFAELIVAECIEKIETYCIPVGNSAAGEMACEWTYDALKEIRDEIKEHFGVKE